MSDATVSAASRVLTTLPPAFLALVLLNLAFICGVLWFLNGVDARRVAFEQAEAEGRARLLTPLLSACINEVPAAELQKLLHPSP